MKAIERLYKYIDYKGIKPTGFEKEIGLSNGYLSIQKKRNADIGESVLNKIIDNCRDLNPEWLLTGNGEMIKKEGVFSSFAGNIIAGNQQKVSNIDMQYGGSRITVDKSEIEMLKKEISHLNNIIEEKERLIQILLNK